VVREFPKLVELLNHNFPDFPTDALLDLVKTYELPALVMLLEFLKQDLPDSSGHGLSDVLRNVLPGLVQSLGIPHTPAAPLPEAPVSALAEAPVSAPTDAPVSAPPEAGDPAPDLPKVGLPEPDPPKSVAQSPEGGPDGCSSGGPDGSSPGGE
jgi:hypothetical protein